MRRISRFLILVAALSLVAAGLLATPAGALSVDKAELRGNELRIEGGDAASNADIVVDGITVGSANGGGAFDIRFSPFSSATCVATVQDGVDTQQVELDRCTPSGPPVNQDPTANAGPNQTVIDSDENGSETVTLDGSGSSDAEGPIASFAWTEGGASVGTGPNPAVTLAVGPHTITLTVTDGDGATASDQVIVIVNAPAVNQPPVATAGPDQTVTDSDGSGAEVVTLDGSGSADPDGPIASFAWAEGATSLGSSASISPSLTVGAHTITLTVTDADGATASDQVIVTVDPQPVGNQPPIADAGPDIVRTDDDGNGLETVILESFNSTDPDGTIVSYEWSKDGSVIASANGVAISQPVGVNTITLTVTDNQGATATDVLVVTVNPQPVPGNQDPVANAGPDQTVIDTDNNGVETVTLDGSASTDADGIILDYEWTENGVPLGAAGQANLVQSQPGITANAVVAGTFDHLLESNQADPPGIVPNSFGGAAAGAGDVNNDGFADLIVGAEVWVNSTGDIAGSATVFLGGPNGPVGTNPSNANTLIELDQAGNTVDDVASAGDVNGDGFDDVVVGSATYQTTLPGTQLAVNGAAFVFHGGPNGIAATSPAQADASIFANQLGSALGEWVDAAGDVNGDGFGDILVSVPRQGTLFPPAVPINDRSGNYGMILVFHGGPNGITGTGITDADAVILPYEDTGEPLPPVDAQVGEAAGAGDINGDGFDDIVVGGTEVTVYLGGPNGIVAQDIFDADDRIFGVPPLGVSQSIGGAGPGFVVNGAGDVNGDGFADVIASLPGRDLNPGDVPVGEGAAYIFLGGPTGLAVSSVSQAHTTFFGVNTGDTVGNTVGSAGDVDGDGFDDVLISARAFAGSLDAEGVAYLYRGSAQGITASTIAEADSRLEASQSGATRHENRYGLDAQGAGDINGDGFADVIVGKAFYDNGELNEGAVFIYNGQPFPANPNQPPVAVAGPNQEIYDVDADGRITVSVDGSASFDPDGSIVSYEWYLATINGGTGETFLGSGPTGTFDLPLISPIPAYGHLLTLVVTDDQGLRRGDVMAAFPRLAPTTFEFAEWGTLNAWTTTGDLTLGNAPGVSFPDPPHVLMRGAASLERTFTPAADTTGLDIQFWARGDSFGPSDTVAVQASFDGGPFTDYFTLTAADATGNFVFYGGSAFPISMSSWPNTASSITLRFESNLSAGADAWLAALTVRSIQAPTGGTTNQPPTANAGPDQSVVDNDGGGDQAVTLNGSASFDPDGSIASYEWRNGQTVIGSTVGITTTLAVGTHTLTLAVTDNLGATDFDTVEVTVLPQPVGPTLTVDLAVGVHTITLLVTDDDGAIATDTVVITVEAGGPTNQLPTAHAGPDQTVADADNTGQEFLTLDGSGSSDVEGPIASYVWFENGVQVAAGVSPSVPVPVGSRTLTLTVTDSDGATASDTVVLTVEPFDPTTNEPPVANAGPDQTVVDTDGNTLEVVTFDGTGSFDPDGTIVSYNWTLQGNPFGNAPTFDVTRPLGTYVVTLTVTDNLGATASDTVTVVVEAAPDPGNIPPVANAGPDFTLADPDGDGVASASVDGTGSSDPDGSIASYEWRLNDALVGTSAIQGIPFPVGVNTLELTVRDNNDATGVDTAIVTVTANIAPTAVAGPDQTVNDADGDGSEVVAVSAAGSSDPDGTVDSWAWRENGNVIATTETANLPLTVGTHTIELTVTDNGGTTAIDTVVITVEAGGPPPGEGEMVFVSSSSGGSVGGVSFADEDILVFDTSTSSWAMFLDGSDVGLGGAGARDIDAFAVLDDGSVLLSIVNGSTLPDVGAIDDSDVVRFVPSSIGTTTAGTFELYFDGSDVGLTSNGEDVDAISVLSNGDLLISTTGNASVPGLSLADEDVARFAPSSLGATTSGSWSAYFDGSDVALNNASSEDVHGVWVDGNGDVYLTTRGTFAVAGASGTGADVFACTGHGPGAATSCAGTSLFFDGSTHGYGSEVMDGLHITRN